MTNETQRKTVDAAQLPTPSELEGKDLGSPTTNTSESIDRIMPDEVLVNEKSMIGFDAYAQHIHTYIREYIAAADRKASFIFTISAAILIYFYEKGAMDSWTKSIMLWSIGEVVISVAIVFLTASCVLAVLVVFPRLTGSRAGFVYWNSIAEFDTGTEFANEVIRLEGAVLTNELIRHSYELSRVCRAKYYFLNWAIRVGTIGALLSVLFIVTGIQ